MFLYLIQNHAMQIYGGMKVYSSTNTMRNKSKTQVMDDIFLDVLCKNQSGIVFKIKFIEKLGFKM